MAFAQQVLLHVARGVARPLSTNGTRFGCSYVASRSSSVPITRPVDRRIGFARHDHGAAFAEIRMDTPITADSITPGQAVDRILDVLG